MGVLFESHWEVSHVLELDVFVDVHASCLEFVTEL